jgi:hypothetical protein
MKYQKFLTVRGTSCSMDVREKGDSDGELGRTTISVLDIEPGSTIVGVLKGEDTTYNRSR